MSAAAAVQKEKDRPMVRTPDFQNWQKGSRHDACKAGQSNIILARYQPEKSAKKSGWVTVAS